jgi:hypothetical protein
MNELFYCYSLVVTAALGIIFVVHILSHHGCPPSIFCDSNSIVQESWSICLDSFVLFWHFVRMFNADKWTLVISRTNLKIYLNIWASWKYLFSFFRGEIHLISNIFIILFILGNLDSSISILLGCNFAQ